MSKPKLNCRNRLDQVLTMRKTRQDNNVIDHTNMVDTENENKITRPIEWDMVYDEDQTRQGCD